MEKLTSRQEKALQFLSDYLRRHGYAPSVRELASALRIGTPKGAADHLKTLERKGYIEREPGKPRAIRIVNHESGIPIVGSIAAGTPILAEENLDGTLPIASNHFGRGDLFALRVHGDSMSGDQIRDGDLAIIRKQNRVEPSEIAAVQVEDEATLKRIRRRGDRIELRPSNPTHKPIVLTGGEVRVLGRYVGLVRG